MAADSMPRRGVVPICEGDGGGQATFSIVAESTGHPSE